MSIEEEQIDFQLGDRVYIAASGPLDGLRGRIYYLDESLLRILPDGTFHRVEDITIIDGDFDPTLNITNAYVLKKRVSPAFVVQHDFHTGYLAETIDESGKMGITYTIKSVDEDEDSVVLKDETGAEKKLVFGFVGIPQDEEFTILRVRQPPESIAENNAADAAASAAVAGPLYRTEEEEGGLELLDSLDVPQVMEIREIYATQRYYPDVVQRNDMLQDLLSALSVKQQKSPQKQSEIRKLVETMMLLRNQFVNYTRSGEPSGHINTFYSTLNELLEKGVVPLSRRVVDAKRVLYLDHTVNHIRALETDPTETIFTGVTVQYLEDALKASNEYAATTLGGLQGQPILGNALPNWYLSWEGFFSSHQKSWTAGGGDRKPFNGDTEFFRRPIPEMGEERNVDGISNTALSSENDIITTEDITKINISMLRGLGPRVGRIREKESPRTVESAESVATESYVLFPLKYDRELGAIRSGKLALDMGKALMPSMTMESILLKQPISDVPSAGAIFNVSGPSLGNITIEDWLIGQPLESKGMGDVMNLLSSFGFSSRELHVDQMAVVIDKLNTYRALVRKTIQEINEKSKVELEGLSLQNNPLLLPEVVQERVNQFMGEPTFQKAIHEFQMRFPSYRENDIALFAFLFVNYYDFTLAVLAGSPVSLQREVRRKARGEFLRRLYESALTAEKTSRKVLTISEKPTVPRSHVKEYRDGDVRSVNPCAHVSSLTMIRKIKNDTLRMKALLEFTTRFSGEKRDNWIHCKVCSQHALCVHERLLLQEYLKPLEKDLLHKELLLTFSRTQFHGKYCCSNCGQSIGDLEYDSSLEYDDEGKPMSGRAVLVDKDSIFHDALDYALGAPVDKLEEIKFATETQTEAYKTAYAIATRIGVRITEEGYRKIAQRVAEDIAKQPTREGYSQFQKAQKAKGLGTIDYDVLRNRILVTSTAAYLLVELQTGIPTYTTRYRLPGCSKVGFSGFPTGAKEQTTGVEYLSCAIAGISDNVAPWNLTGFLKEKSLPKRQAEIAKLLLAAAGNTLKNSDVQQDMALKKEDLERTNKGNVIHEEGLVESIPAGFVPEQGGAASTAVAAAANEREKGRAWILLANDIAKQTTTLGSGSPYSETTCCFHSLQTPTSFWDDKELPALLTSKGSVGGRGSHLAVHYTARKQDHINVVAPDSILYRVFLQVCFEGPRRGLPHEPGYDHLCPHCGFQFPRSNEILTPEEGMSALQTQNIDTSRVKFQELLDESHSRYSVKPVLPIQLVTGLELLTKLRELEPAPFEEWKAVLSNTILAIQSFPQDKPPEETDIATAYGPLSNMAEEFRQELIERLGPDIVRIADRLVSQSPTALVQSLQTYFLIPFQRIQSKFNTESLKVQKSYELGEGTEEDLHGLLRNHLAYLDEIKKHLGGTTKAKMEDARRKLMASVPLLQHHIRTSLLPGGVIGLPYLLQAMVLGIFAECANPNIISKRASAAGASATDARGAMKVISICLERFRAEGMNFTQDEIRSMIARREEVEKMRMISKFDRMTPEQRAAELLNKRLGLGDWAIGGSDKIRLYNEDQYERERIERGEMVGLMGGAPPADEVGREAGYSNEQTAADDL